jgi:hypothetical protein
MRILLTGRGPHLATLIGQFAREFAQHAEVRVLAYFASSHKWLRDQGIETYDPAILASMGEQLCSRCLADHVSGEGITLCYKGISLIDSAHFERCRAKIEGRPTTTEQLIRRALRTAAAIDTILAEFQPDVVAVWNGCIMEARLCAELAVQAGCEVRYCERGLLPNSLVIDPQGVNAQSYLCTPAWDEIAASPVGDADVGRVRSFMRGLTRTGASVVDQPDRCSPDTLRRRLNLPDDSHLILLPAQIDSDTNIVYNSPNFATNTSVLSALMAAVREHPRLHVIFKPHPEEPSTYDVAGVLGERGSVVADVNLHSLIDAADAIVVRNSTVGLEAAMHEKPVVVLGRALYSHKGFTLDLPSPSDLLRVLSQALDKGFDEAMKQRLEQFMIYITRNYLYFLDGHEIFPESNERLVDELLDLARRAQPVYAVPGPFSPALDASLKEIRERCDRSRAVLDTAAAIKRRRLQQALLIQACDHHQFLRALRHVARSGLAARYTVLARSPRDAGAIRGMKEVEKLGCSWSDGVKEIAKARLGACDLVIFVINNSGRMSKKARWLRRFLAGVPLLLIEWGLADALNLPPASPADRGSEDADVWNARNSQIGVD